MTYYMYKPTGKPTGLPFTMPVEHEVLRKGCYLKGGRFHSVLKHKGNIVNLGVFETASECNSVWDRSKARRKIKDRVPSAKGYTKATIGTTQKVNMFIGGVQVYIGTFASEKEARAVYLVEFHAETKRMLEALN